MCKQGQQAVSSEEMPNAIKQAFVTSKSSDEYEDPAAIKLQVLAELNFSSDICSLWKIVVLIIMFVRCHTQERGQRSKQGLLQQGQHQCPELLLNQLEGEAGGVTTGQVEAPDSLLQEFKLTASPKA